MAENVQLKQSEHRLKSEKEKLETDKAQLEQIKTVASALQASDIVVEPINDKNRPRKRINYIAKIRTDFVVRANSVASAGEKTIYLRLIRPDSVALGSAEMLVIEYNGRDLPVSASRTVTYENQDLPVSIFWDNNGELVPGEYTLELYCEENIIGKSVFVL